MGSWADLDLPAPVVRTSVAATAAVAAATAGNDHEHQNSNWKKKQRMVLHDVGVITAEYPLSPPSCLVSSRMKKAWLPYIPTSILLSSCSLVFVTHLIWTFITGYFMILRAITQTMPNGLLFWR